MDWCRSLVESAIWCGGSRLWLHSVDVGSPAAKALIYALLICTQRSLSGTGICRVRYPGWGLSALGSSQSSGHVMVSNCFRREAT